jgi:hypothetical protein
MDFSSAVKSDSLRPVATIVAPGAVAVSPYVVILGYYVPVVTRFWNEHEAAFAFIVALSILTAGFILEEVGSLIEVGWDAKLMKQYDFHGDVWRIYLQLKLKDDIVGQRYLRDVLTHMKFELAMSPALLLCVVALVWINAIYAIWSACTMFFIALVLLAISAFLLWESYQSAELLSRTRRAIVDAMRLDVAADLFKPSASKTGDEGHSEHRESNQ